MNNLLKCIGSLIYVVVSTLIAPLVITVYAGLYLITAIKLLIAELNTLTMAMKKTYKRANVFSILKQSHNKASAKEDYKVA